VAKADEVAKVVEVAKADEVAKAVETFWKVRRHLLEGPVAPVAPFLKGPLGL